MPRRRQQIERETTLAEGFADLRADYSAAKTSRYRRTRTGVNPMGSGADYHYRTEVGFLRLIELARAIDRDDPVLGQGITRAIDNILQDGIPVDPQTNDGKLDAELIDRWEMWSTDPRLAHKGAEFDLHELADKVLRAMLIDGDMLVLPLKDGSVELVEAHRLRTPTNTKRNVVRGVLLDKYRKPIEYWVTKDDIDSMRLLQKVSDIQVYPAWDSGGNRQVLHIKNPKRASQTRGVSILAPIVDLLGMHDDIQFATMVKVQVASCYAILRTRPEGVLRAGDDDQTGSRTTETMSDGVSRTIEGISPGMIIDGQEGEKLEGFTPNIPSPQYVEHIWTILQIIAANIGIPAHVLLLDPSKTNFSGWRGAIEQARIGFRRLQGLMIRQFYRPLYQWKVRQWLVKDPTLRKLADVDGVDVMRHRWHPPTWPYIEPKKDAEADALRVNELLTSKRRLQNERGRNWPDVAKENVEDNALLINMAIEKADEIKKAHPDAEVDWHELAGMKLPGTVQLETREREGMNVDES